MSKGLIGAALVGPAIFVGAFIWQCGSTLRPSQSSVSALESRVEAASASQSQAVQTAPGVRAAIVGGVSADSRSVPVVVGSGSYAMTEGGGPDAGAILTGGGAPASERQSALNREMSRRGVSAFAPSETMQGQIDRAMSRLASTAAASRMAAVAGSSTVAQSGDGETGVATSYGPVGGMPYSYSQAQTPPAYADTAAGLSSGTVTPAAESYSSTVSTETPGTSVSAGSTSVGTAASVPDTASTDELAAMGQEMLSRDLWWTEIVSQLADDFPTQTDAAADPVVPDAHQGDNIFDILNGQ